MKNQDQANNLNNLNDPTVPNDPQAQVEDLPISGEQEERVKGGYSLNRSFVKSWSTSGDADDRPQAPIDDLGL